MINGFDSLGHYLRTELIAKLACGIYMTTPVAECNANFPLGPARPAPELARLATRARAPRVAGPRAGRERPAGSFWTHSWDPTDEPARPCQLTTKPAAGGRHDGS